MSDRDRVTRTYTNGEVRVLWRAGVCVHSAVCFRGLPRVFDPRRRPWVDVSAASTEEIVRQVSACPSGALAYVLEAASPGEPAAPAPAAVLVEPSPDGPLRVEGNLELRAADGTTERRSGVTSFCRCGASASKPLCDGSHRRVGFRG